MTVNESGACDCVTHSGPSFVFEQGGDSVIHRGAHFEQGENVSTSVVQAFEQPSEQVSGMTPRSAVPEAVQNHQRREPLILALLGEIDHAMSRMDPTRDVLWLRRVRAAIVSD